MPGSCPRTPLRSRSRKQCFSRGGMDCGYCAPPCASTKACSVSAAESPCCWMDPPGTACVGLRGLKQQWRAASSKQRVEGAATQESRRALEGCQQASVAGRRCAPRLRLLLMACKSAIAVASQIPLGTPDSRHVWTLVSWIRARLVGSGASGHIDEDAQLSMRARLGHSRGKPRTCAWQRSRSRCRSRAFAHSGLGQREHLRICVVGLGEKDH